MTFVVMEECIRCKHTAERALHEHDRRLATRPHRDEEPGGLW